MLTILKDTGWTLNYYFVFFQGEVQHELIKVQPQFKGTLVTNVEIFQRDTTQFYTDYATVS